MFWPFWCSQSAPGYTCQLCDVLSILSRPHHLELFLLNCLVSHSWAWPKQKRQLIKCVRGWVNPYPHPLCVCVCVSVCVCVCVCVSVCVCMCVCVALKYYYLYPKIVVVFSVWNLYASVTIIMKQYYISIN